MSDTPRTDVAQHNMGSVVEPHYVVDVEVAQGLERELDEKTRLLSVVDGAVIRIANQADEYQQQRNVAIAKLEELRVEQLIRKGE